MRNQIEKLSIACSVFFQHIYLIVKLYLIQIFFKIITHSQYKYEKVTKTIHHFAHKPTISKSSTRLPTPPRLFFLHFQIGKSRYRQGFLLFPKSALSTMVTLTFYIYTHAEYYYDIHAGEPTRLPPLLGNGRRRITPFNNIFLMGQSPVSPTFRRNKIITLDEEEKSRIRGSDSRQTIRIRASFIVRVVD